MPTLSKPAFLHCLSSLHAGTGQGLDDIDQPIAREAGTSLPYVPGSSIRGRLRDHFHGHPYLIDLFGPDSQNASDHAGALTILPARLLLLPVAALAESFVYVTSPIALSRFVTLLNLASISTTTAPAVPVMAADTALLSEPSLATTFLSSPHLLVHQLALPIVNQQDGTNAARAWANYIAERLFPGTDDVWRRLFIPRLAIVDDANFTFLAKYATEVTTHVKIDDQTGTAEDHKLWYQENLPAETVLVTLLSAQNSMRPNAQCEQGQPGHAKSLLDTITEIRGIDMGGKTGSGHGVVRFLPF
jgi:CRISPR-associated protein Cmr4